MPDLRGAFPTRTAAGSILLLPLAGAAVALALLPIVTTDLTGYVLPWLDALRSRGASGLSGEFSNYTPPYLYLLYLAGGLAQVVGPVASIKLLNLPFVAAMAATIGLFVCRITGDRHRGLVAGSVLCVTPTVLVNAFAWGQSDCIYATFLLLFLLFASAGRPLAAAAMFGLALSFKAQSLFLAPLLLYLFLSGQMRLRHLLAIPCIYLLMMVPAAMAGRPWKELLTVYYVQALDSAELSVFAANPWWFVGHFHLMSPLAGLIAGILLGGATGLAIALASLMLRRGAGTNLLVAAVSAAALPYVLPRMHDRYFFIADLLTLAMAFAWPRYWLAAVLFQAGSLTSYLAYFGLSATGPGFAVVPMTAGLVLLLSAFREQLDGRPAISLAHVINCAFNPLTINENHGDDS